MYFNFGGVIMAATIAKLDKIVKTYNK
ncbi:ABC transporter ATP-binding protein, partial [Staphylococcus aureus]